MEERIRQYFNELFAEAQKTRKMLDLKEEMTRNALDKYSDLIADGYAAEDAYENVIHSIGDVSELIAETEEKNLLALPEAERRKIAMMKAIAVGLYIFAGVVFFFCAMLPWNKYIDFQELGLCLGGLICIPPTIMLVYAANMYPGFSRKEEQDLVEDYKEMRHKDNRDRAIRKSVSTIIWTVTVMLYFVISFYSHAWAVSWIIFLIAACVQAIAGLLFSLRADR